MTEHVSPADHTQHDADGDPGTSPNAVGQELPDHAAYRRAPRYGRFILTGILIAGIVAFVAVLLTRGQSEYTPSDLFWLLMIVLGPLGIGGGAVTALILDRRSMKKADRQR